MNEPLRLGPHPTVSDILKDFLNKGEKLLRLEVNLIRAQIAEELQEKQKAGILLGSGLLIGLVGVAVAAAALIDLLVATTQLPLWAAEAVTAGVFVGTAGVIVAVLSSRSTKKNVHSVDKPFKPSHPDNVTQFPDPTLR